MNDNKEFIQRLGGEAVTAEDVALNDVLDKLMEDSSYAVFMETRVDGKKELRMRLMANQTIEGVMALVLHMMDDILDTKKFAVFASVASRRVMERMTQGEVTPEMKKNAN